MKKAVVLMIVLALACLWALAADAVDIPADKEVIEWQAKIGKMTFKHKEHAEAINDCTKCHHQMEEGKTAPAACSECHDKKEVIDDAPKFKKALHDTCTGCHLEERQKGNEAGPVLKWEEKKECKTCHIKEKKP